MSMFVEPTPETGIEPTTDVEELEPEDAPTEEDYDPPVEPSPDKDGSEADVLEQAIEVPPDEDDEIPS